MVNDPAADWQHHACFLARSEHAKGYKSCQNTHGYLLHVPLPCFTPLLACLRGNARTPPEQQWSIGFSSIPRGQFSPGPDPVASKLYYCESSEGCPLCRKEAGSFPHGVLFCLVFFLLKQFWLLEGKWLKLSCVGSVQVQSCLSMPVSHQTSPTYTLSRSFSTRLFL